jgi:hypothetical protein
MKEWKLRQQIFHKIFSETNLGDNLDEQVIIEEFDENTIVQRALEYPYSSSAVCHYPGKSFAVAIIFSLLLEKNFGDTIYNYLSDPDLFMGEDKYFTPYNENKFIYDLILKDFPLESISSPASFGTDIQKTINYFMLEYLFHEDTKIFSPL